MKPVAVAPPDRTSKANLLFGPGKSWLEVQAAKGAKTRAPAEQPPDSLIAESRRIAVVAIPEGMAPDASARTAAQRKKSRLPVCFVRLSGDPAAVDYVLANAETVVLVPDLDPLEMRVTPKPEPRRRAAKSERNVTLGSHEFPQKLSTARAAFETAFLLESLRRHGGNISETAKSLGISRRSLQLRLRKRGLPPCPQGPSSLLDAPASNAPSPMTT